MNFFGLTPSYRPVLHKEIHEIIFYGRGGYDWLTVYSMPIWLRRFYFKCISDSYKEEKDAQKKAADIGQKKKVSKPGIK